MSALRRIIRLVQTVFFEHSVSIYARVCVCVFATRPYRDDNVQAEQTDTPLPSERLFCGRYDLLLCWHSPYLYVN